MPEIALVTFLEQMNGGSVGVSERAGVFIRSGILKRYSAMAFYRFLFRKRFESGIEIVQADSSSDFLNIRLPFPKSWLTKLNEKYLDRYISRICEEYGCSRYFCPPGADLISGSGHCSLDLIARKMVFQSLLIPVLEEIVRNIGIRLDQLDIVLVNGNHPAGLLSVVRRLEPFVNCLKIAVSPGEQALQDELAGIAENTGLSIYVGSNVDRLTGNSDLILNFAEPSRITDHKIKSNALVLQFGNEDLVFTRAPFHVLNGVRFLLGDELQATLDKKLQGGYSGTGLAEILLASKTGIFNRSGYAETIAEKAEAEFRNCSCKITGFSGRRGELPAGELYRELKLRS